jgi:hypothetical protein
MTISRCYFSALLLGSIVVLLWEQLLMPTARNERIVPMKAGRFVFCTALLMCLPQLLPAMTESPGNDTAKSTSAVTADVSSVRARTSPDAPAAISTEGTGAATDTVQNTDAAGFPSSPRRSQRALQSKKICWLPFDKTSFS